MATAGIQWDDGRKMFVVDDQNLQHPRTKNKKTCPGKGSHVWDGKGLCDAPPKVESVVKSISNEYSVSKYQRLFPSLFDPVLFHSSIKLTPQQKSLSITAIGLGMALGLLNILGYAQAAIFSIIPSSVLERNYSSTLEV